MAVCSLQRLGSHNEARTISTDQQRLEAIVQYRDQNAFEELYVAHQRSVKAAVTKLCHNPQTVEEIVQRTFHTLWERAERLVTRSLNLRAWLLTVARNAVIDHHRAERVSYVGLDVVAEVASLDQSPFELALVGLESARVTAALGTLTPEQKQIIELHYLGGYSFQKIALLTTTPLGTVKSRAYQGLERLRAELA